MKVVLFLSVILVIALALKANPDTFGTFVGRSGDIIILPAQDQYEVQVQLSSVTDSLRNHILDTQFQGAVARSVGLPSDDTASSALPVQFNIFDAPKANLLIVVESESQARIANSLTARVPTFTVRPTFSPVTQSSLMATLTTGQSPATHGIIGDAWMAGKEEVAFVDAFPLSASVMDVASTQGSFVLSAGSNSRLVAALGTHPDLSNGVSAVYFTDAQAFLDADGQIVYTLAEAQALLASTFPTFSTVDLPEQLIAEAAYLLHLKDVASVSTLNFLSVSVSKCNDARALELLSMVVEKAVADLEVALDGKVTWQIVYVVARGVAPERDVLAHLFDHESERILQFFPHLYTSAVEMTNELCEALETVKELTIRCQHVEKETRVAALRTKRATVANTPVLVTDEQAAIFQMNLWTGVILAVIALMTIYAMTGVQIDKDSIIFKATAPAVSSAAPSKKAQ